MGRTILVVDDDDGIIEVVRIILEGEGYQVRANMDGNLHHIFTNDLPDLILLDVLIASIDGREICQSLKKHDRTHSIPVIMLSAHSDAYKIAEDSGADGFLEKPFDVDMLIDIVARHLPSTETV